MKKYLKILLVTMLALSMLTSVVCAEGRVTWPENPEPVTLKIFVDCTWLKYDTLDGIIPQWIEEQTGIKVDMTKCADGQQIALLVASGDMPYDLIMTDKADMFRELSADDMCHSFDDLIVQYVPNWEVPAAERLMNASFSEDGKAYMIRNYFNTSEEIKQAAHLGVNNNTFHVRRDIFDTLGIEELPTSEEGYMEMLQAVKEKYPDMVPMVFCQRNYWPFAHLAGLDVNMPKDENGNLCHYMSDPHFYDFLRIINKMYRAGYILEENFSWNSDEQYKQYVSNAQGFMIATFGSNADISFTASAREVNPDALFEHMPLADNYAMTFAVSGWAGCFITKSCTNPEAAIKLIAWLKDGDNQIASQAGVKGIDWEWDENGAFKALDRYNKAQADGTLYPAYNPDVSFILSASTYLSEGAITYSTGSESGKMEFDQSLARANFSNIIGLCSPVANSDEGIIATNLTDLMTEYFPIVCMSKDDAEFDANYQKFMAEAKEIGVDQYNGWRNSTYVSLCEQYQAK